MYGLINVELLMKFLCISSFDNKNTNFVPDTCALNETSYGISQRRDTYASELCLENGCFTKDSGKFTSMLVDTDVLVSLLSNYSNCNVCLTNQCYKEAFEILSSLDEDVDPCDDFYQFACGGWLKRHTIPKEKSYVSVYSKLEDNIQLQLKSILEKVTENDPDYIRMIKGIYQSCMDTESLNRAGSKPLKKVLKDLGGWPVVEGDNWDPESFDWIDTLIKLRTKGFSHDTLIGLSVVKDPHNSTNHVIKLDQPSLRLQYDYLQRNLNNKEKSDYFDLMLKAAYVLSTNDSSLLEFNSTNTDVFSKSLSEALNFETDLSKLFSPGKYREKYTVQKLMDEAKQVDWLKYFNGLIYARIYKDENLFIDDVDYIKQFSQYISKADKRVVANYMIWRVVHEALPLLSKQWRTLGQRTVDKPDVSENQPRWEQCLSSLMDDFGVAINTYYVRNYSNNRIQFYAEYMLFVLQFILPQIIMQNEWMDRVAKEMASDKAQAMKLHVSYPFQLLNDSLIAKRYENLKLTNESYFDKAMKVRKWSIDNSLSQLRTTSQNFWIKVYQWSVKGQEVQLHGSKEVDIFTEYPNGSSAQIIYNYHNNRLELPAGILQQAFLNRHRPDSLNWGALGFKIAREMSQAFFDEGRFYDKDGNLVNWWRPDVQWNFEWISNCFIKKYGDYIEDEYGLNLEVDGEKTEAQNIADSAGLKAAYVAYKKFVKARKNEMLPRLKYTPDQLFWISAAHVMCEKQTKEYLEQQFRGKSYVPPKFRVRGGMSNLPEFSKDFNCPSDAPMNPKVKCQIW